MKYSTGFMEGGSLTLGTGYETASDGGGGDDESAMRAGLNISVDQISFGGSMYDEDGVGMQYDIGASWTEGATELGLQYGHDEASDAGLNIGPFDLHARAGRPDRGPDRQFGRRDAGHAWNVGLLLIDHHRQSARKGSTQVLPFFLCAERDRSL